MTTKKIRVVWSMRGLDGEWKKHRAKMPATRTYALELVNSWDPVPGWKVELYDGSGFVKRRDYDHPEQIT